MACVNSTWRKLPVGVSVATRFLKISPDEFRNQNKTKKQLKNQV